MTALPLHVIWQLDQTMRRGVEPREFQWICSLLDGLDLIHHMDSTYSVLAPSPLVVLEGYRFDPSQLRQYLATLTEVAGPVGVIHVGDEFGRAPIDAYDNAAFVYRNYWRPEIETDSRWYYLPLGVNCDPRLFTAGSMKDRRYRWSFAGQAKMSRRTMIDVLHSRSDGHLVVNQEFNSGLPKDQYAQLLSDTQIVLCPRGWSSVESYRLYEALEAGAIPLVEDYGGPGLFREHAASTSLWNAVKGGPKYWYDLARRSRQSSYWLHAYGPEFPCPRIYRWENVDQVLDTIDQETLAPTIAKWWTHYKSALRDRLQRSITGAVSSSCPAALTSSPASRSVS